MPLRHMSPQPLLRNTRSTTCSGSGEPIRSMTRRYTTNGRRALLGTEPSSANISDSGSGGFGAVVMRIDRANNFTVQARWRLPGLRRAGLAGPHEFDEAGEQVVAVARAG